jgi:hypothetical protein
MKWRRVVSGSAKWGCSAMALVLAAAFVANRWYVLEIRRVSMPLADEGLRVRVISGLIMVKAGGVLHVTFAEPFVWGPDQGGVFALEKEQTPLWKWKLERSVASTHPWVFVPLWMPFAPLALAAGALWYPGVRLTWRRRRGSCLTCGYSRQGLAADVVCPECGSVPSPK